MSNRNRRRIATAALVRCWVMASESPSAPPMARCDRGLSPLAPSGGAFQMKRGVRRVRSVTLFLLSGALGAWIALMPSVARPADLAHPVLAYYYAWWDPDVFQRTLFQPFDAYNSDAQDVMQRHIQQARSAGIDGFIVAWYGNGDRTDSNLAHLLDLGQAS